MSTSPAPDSRPWLSILIPVYNVRPYLADCLDSLRRQPDTGVEILLLDDASTDGSAALMTRLAGLDGRIRCLSHARNRGLSAARNTLLDASLGHYLWFLDSDDLLAPGTLAGLRPIAHDAAPDLVLCDFRLLRERMTLKHRWRGEWHMRAFTGPARRLLRDRSLLLQGMFESGHLHAWSKIARREVWGETLRFPEGRLFEDMATMPWLALRAGSYWYEPQPWLVYRQRPGSILTSPPSLAKAEHQSSALDGLPDAASGLALTPAAQFAWAHFAARSFISSAKTAHALQPGREAALVAHYLANLEQQLPIPLAELQAGYLRRGWWLRARRLRRWLALARPAHSGQPAQA